MKTLSSALLAMFNQRMITAPVPVDQRMDYRKWLRFYLDFCAKYHHPPRDPDSLEPFLQKLASKNQSKVRQEQAAASVNLFYEIIRAWPASRPIRRDRSGKVSPAKSVNSDRVHQAGGTPALPKPPSMVREGALQHGDTKSPDSTWADCYRRLKEEIRLRQYSPKTLATYRIWAQQFEKFLESKSPSAISSDDAVRFQTYLANESKVVASTQNQAFNALLFLYRHILKADYDLKDKVVRARRTKYIPTVLTREEVDRVISLLEYPYNLITGVLYGCGLRLFEGLNLRVGCINFDEMMVTV